MKIKKFEAPSMKEALEKIKEEMGPDAFILSTKQISKKGPLGFGDRKFLQITAAVEVDEEKPKAEVGSGIDIRQPEERNDLKRLPSPEKKHQPPPGIPTYNMQGKQSLFGDITKELVNAQAGKDPFTLGFETVFEEAHKQPVKKKASRKGEDDGQKPLRTELSELREMVASLSGQTTDLSPIQEEFRELKGLLYNVIKNQSPIFGKSLTPTLITFYQQLKDCGVDERLAAKLIRLVDSKLPDAEKDNRNKVSGFLYELLRQSIEVSGPQTKAKRPRVVALVGPTGVGKTTTLSKLAAYTALQEQSGVAFITLDTYRIAAVDQLKTYAKIMEIPVQVALNKNELKQAIQFHQDKALILVDTAGHSHRDQAGMAALQEFLNDSGQIEVHLVMSATTKGSDLTDIASRFEMLKPDYLLFTKLDETTAYGELFNQIVKSKKPVSYVTTGQNVPEDFEFATREMLAGLILGYGLDRYKGGNDT